MNYGKNVLKWLPYIYFFVGLLLISRPQNNIFVIILSIPFVIQLFFQLRYLDPVLGILTFILSIWLMLAYASDLHKITIVTSQSRRFIAMGGMIVLVNFIMSALLFRNAIHRVDKSVAD